jgi:hypothetical protein
MATVRRRILNSEVKAAQQHSPRIHARATLRMLALGIAILGLLAGCSRPTPGLPQVWPGQAVTPNVQARSGDTIKLRIYATNDSSNLEYGGASQVRTFTALPEGVTLLGFRSSDDGRLAPEDQNRAWVEDIDNENRVVTISFGPIGPKERKTATLTLRIDAPNGSPLAFGTTLAWVNQYPDTIECDNACATSGLDDLKASSPQLGAYAEAHPERVQALLKAYAGGGGALANPLALTVGDTTINSTTPRLALLADSHKQPGMTLTTKAAFTPNEPVMLWYNLPDGTSVFLFRTDALDDGSIITGTDIAGWAAIPTTATSITARGQYSEVEAIYYFNRP